MSEEELGAAVGGVTCQTALNLAKGYTAISGLILAVGGSSVQAATFAGKAQGVLQGGCPA
jgi:hypothetical protein